MLNDKQKIRFILVGGTNTAIDFGILFLLTGLGLNTIAANFISTSIAFVFSFTANRKFTFRASSGNLRRQLILFVLVTFFGLWVIQPVVIYFSRGIMTQFIDTDWLLILLPKIAATGCSLVWNYVLYSRYVFTSESTLK